MGRAHPHCSSEDAKATESLGKDRTEGTTFDSLSMTVGIRMVERANGIQKRGVLSWVWLEGVMSTLQSCSGGYKELLKASTSTD